MIFHRYSRLFVIILLVIFIGIGSPLSAGEKGPTVLYDLNVKIEPAAGTIAVRGKIEVPVEAESKGFQFGLHETFAINRLTVNGQPPIFRFILSSRVHYLLQRET
jgi:hypothetical protein